MFGDGDDAPVLVHITGPPADLAHLHRRPPRTGAKPAAARPCTGAVPAPVRTTPQPNALRPASSPSRPRSARESCGSPPPRCAPRATANSAPQSWCRHCGETPPAQPRRPGDRLPGCPRRRMARRHLGGTPVVAIPPHPRVRRNTAPAAHRHPQRPRQWPRRPAPPSARCGCTSRWRWTCTSGPRPIPELPHDLHRRPGRVLPVPACRRKHPATPRRDERLEGTPDTATSQPRLPGDACSGRIRGSTVRRDHRRPDDEGWRVSQNTVAALMRELGLAARPNRRPGNTTRPGRGRWRAPDLMGVTSLRRSAAQVVRRRHRIETAEGQLYLASVLDMGSRRLPWFSLGEHHDAQLAYGALVMAVSVRGGKDAIAGVMSTPIRAATFADYVFKRSRTRRGSSRPGRRRPSPTSTRMCGSPSPGSKPAHFIPHKVSIRGLVFDVSRPGSSTRSPRRSGFDPAAGAHKKSCRIGHPPRRASAPAAVGTAGDDPRH